MVPEFKELICFLIIHREESSRTPECCWDRKQTPAVSGIFKAFLLWPALLEAFLDWLCASLVVLLSPACHLLCPSRCDRALLAPDGGESHDVFLCVPVVWQSCKNQHFPILWIPLPFCQVGITLQKAPVPVREQFGGIQELLSLEQLLLVQPVL